MQRIDIICADDDPGIINEYRRIFEVEDLTLHAVCNGVELGVALLDYFPYVIILDLAMPEMDGIKALKLLKSSKLTKKCKVIVVSGVINPEQEKLLWDLDATYFKKPVDFDGLVTYVKNAIELIKKGMLREQAGKFSA